MLGLFVVLKRTPLALRSWQASCESVHREGRDGESYISDHIWLANSDQSPHLGMQAHPARPKILGLSVRIDGMVTPSLTSSNRISVSWVASTTRSLSATRTELVGRTLASLINKENISCSRTSRCASWRVACNGSPSLDSFAMVLHAVLCVPEVSMVVTLTQSIVLCLRGNTIGSFELCVASWPVAL